MRWMLAVLVACSSRSPQTQPANTPIANTSVAEPRQIAAGGSHTCLLDHRQVWCWGKNDRGQAGDGTRIEALHPVRVDGLDHPVAISLGNEHSCALDDAGRVACWGRGEDGQLGSGKVDLAKPVRVALPKHAVEIAAGYEHTCARLDGGEVACWGHAEHGELGGATAATGWIVPGVHDAKQLRVGTTHTCVISNDHVSCWGGHWLTGFFGEGHDKQHFTPTDIAALAGVSELAVGSEHVCGRRQGAVICYGSNTNRQLGEPKAGCCEPRSASPRDVHDATTIAAGFRHTCARRDGGTVVCWGADQAADDDTPREIAGLADIEQLAAGAFHTCAMRASGEVLCWGNDENGQLGRGVAGRIPRPSHVVNLTDAVQLAIGYIHSCARRANGAVACWGPGPKQATPSDVAELGAATDVASGIYETCALRADVVRCVQRGRGDDPAGIVTMPTGSSGPLLVGGAGICRRTATGHVACVEEHPDAHTLPGPLPGRKAIEVPGLTDIDRIYVGQQLVCGVGKVVACATFNAPMFRPRNATVPWSAPTIVPGLAAADVSTIAIGDNHSCALLRSNRVACWGFNSTTPVEVKGLDDVVELAAGANHTCARRKNGTVWCWGDDSSGQLGDGDSLFVARPEPARVAGLEGALEIGAGDQDTCARTANGVYCWGSNEAGRLGLGVVPRSETPVAVTGLSTARTR
jgi:alpha-tubulin suppressor-like RCC1 family protein